MGPWLQGAAGTEAGQAPSGEGPPSGSPDFHPHLSPEKQIIIGESIVFINFM